MERQAIKNTFLLRHSICPLPPWALLLFSFALRTVQRAWYCQLFAEWLVPTRSRNKNACIRKPQRLVDKLACNWFLFDVHIFQGIKTIASSTHYCTSVSKRLRAVPSPSYAQSSSLPKGFPVFLSALCDIVQQYMWALSRHSQRQISYYLWRVLETI
jgi:hypothetical protein